MNERIENKAAVDKDIGTGCGQCAEICPVEAINPEDETAVGK